MSNKHTSFKNIPPPPGSKAGNAYTRFIPREELGDFANWQPGSFGGAPAQSGATTTATAAAAEPSAADWQARVMAARQAGYQDGYRDGLVALDNFKQSFAQQATAQIREVRRELAFPLVHGTQLASGMEDGDDAR